MKKKKPFISPKIKAVTLDAEQAILWVCQAGGVYVLSIQSGGSIDCGYNPGGSGYAKKCSFSFRGTQGDLTGNWRTEQSGPVS